MLLTVGYYGFIGVSWLMFGISLGTGGWAHIL
jgi:hypothetical protein